MLKERMITIAHSSKFKGAVLKTRPPTKVSAIWIMMMSAIISKKPLFKPMFLNKLVSLTLTLNPLATAKKM